MVCRASKSRVVLLEAIRTNKGHQLAISFSHSSLCLRRSFVLAPRTTPLQPLRSWIAHHGTQTTDFKPISPPPFQNLELTSCHSMVKLNSFASPCPSFEFVHSGNSFSSWKLSILSSPLPLTFLGISARFNIAPRDQVCWLAFWSVIRAHTCPSLLCRRRSTPQEL